MKAKNWKAWFEQRPLVILAAAVVAACSVTAGVMTYFAQAEKSLGEKSHLNEIERVKTENATKVRELEARLLSIDRRIGSEKESYWDVTSILVTPKQLQVLGTEYTFFDRLDCYVSVPKMEPWQFQETDELQLIRMILGDKIASALAETPIGAAAAKDFPLLLWRGAPIYEIETGNTELSKINVFPFVAIQAFDNKRFFELMGKTAEWEAKTEKDSENHSAKLSPKLDELKEIQQTGNQAKAHEANIASKEATESSKKSESAVLNEDVEHELATVFNGEMAGFFLQIQLQGGFQIAMLVKGATFKVVNADKKGNTLYLHTQIAIPRSQKSEKIYWDRELICICKSDKTFLILTSAPSTDQRTAANLWITSWLAGLRVPMD